MQRYFSILLAVLLVLVGVALGAALGRVSAPRAVETSTAPPPLTAPQTSTAIDLPVRATTIPELPLEPEVGFFDAPKLLELPDRVTPADRDRVRRTLAELLHLRGGLSGHRLRGVEAAAEQIRDEIASRPLRLTTSDGHRLRAVLLHPAGIASGDAPLVLAFHGHGAGLDLLLDPTSYQKGIAVRLARAGFTVLAIETRSFGASGFGALEHQPYANRLRLQGREFHGEAAADHLEILEWARRDAADGGLGHPGPVGAVGASLGGLSVLFLAVFTDSPLDACLVSGAGGSWRASFASLEHCSCSIVPGLLERLDAEHLLAAASCRSLALEVGRYDASLGLAATASVLPWIEGLEARGGPRARVHIHDGGHEHDAEFVTSYFSETLLSDLPRGPKR